jgi:hypothetical protein
MAMFWQVQLSPENKKAATPEPVMDESTQKLMQLLQILPEQLDYLLHIYELLGGNT